jgi:hypothetical protein
MASATQPTGTGANLTGIGSVAWSNPTNIYTSNNVYATTSGGTATNYLKATNFGFSVPSDAVIEGIVVSVERKSSATNRISDTEIKLLKAGTIVGNDKASSSFWPTSDAVASYGSSSDLWGETWTYSDINDTNFGVVLAADATQTVGTTYSVDYISITVYYSILVQLQSTVSQAATVFSALTRELHFATSIAQAPAISVNLTAYANFVAIITQAASIAAKLKTTPNFQVAISQIASVAPTMLLRVRIAAVISQSATVGSFLRVGIRIKSVISQVTSIVARLLISWSQVQPHSATWTNKSSSTNSWTNK